MIYLTGDTHSDFRRFTSANFPEQKEMGKEDYVIVCGDFGGLWDGSKEEKHWLDWLDAKPFTTLFVSGNHENYDLLDAQPAESWNGGLVQRVRPSVLHLMRGQLFTIDGFRVFTMGGASSHDISDGILDPKAPDFRARKKSWTQGMRCTESIMSHGGKESCPTRKSMPRPSELWTAADERLI